MLRVGKLHYTQIIAGKQIINHLRLTAVRFRDGSEGNPRPVPYYNSERGLLQGHPGREATLL